MQNNLFLCILDLGMGKHTKPDKFFLEISTGGDFQTKKKLQIYGPSGPKLFS